MDSGISIVPAHCPTIVSTSIYRSTKIALSVTGSCVYARARSAEPLYTIALGKWWRGWEEGEGRGRGEGQGRGEEEAGGRKKKHAHRNFHLTIHMLKIRDQSLPPLSKELASPVQRAGSL